MSDLTRAALIVNEEVYDIFYLKTCPGCIVALAIDDQHGEGGKEGAWHMVEVINRALNRVSPCESP